MAFVLGQSEPAICVFAAGLLSNALNVCMALPNVINGPVDDFEYEELDANVEYVPATEWVTVFVVRVPQWSSKASSRRPKIAVLTQSWTAFARYLTLTVTPLPKLAL